MNPIFGIAGGLINGLGSLFTGIGQRKRAKEAAAKAEGFYNKAIGYGNQGLDTAKGLLGESRNLYNARMAGAANAEQNIYNSQANTLSNMGRNASDASQLLALAGGVQNNTNNAFGQLGQAEAQNKTMNFGNVMNATGNVQNALGNLQSIYSQRGAEASQAATQLGQAAGQNIAGAINTFGNTGMMAGMGGFGSFSQPQPNFSLPMGNLDSQLQNLWNNTPNPFKR